MTVIQKETEENEEVGAEQDSVGEQSGENGL